MAFFLSNPHGGWEFSAFAVVALADQALRGDGAFTRQVRSAGVAALRALLQAGEHKKS
jgi:putative oxidoreductase